VIREPESRKLAAYLKSTPHVLATSRIALVEVGRAVSVARPGAQARSEATRLLESCLLVDVREELLRAAARLTSGEVRTLDAIHLASAQRVDADELLAYDRRLAEAGRRLGFVVLAPS
jgi:predicted nucleic acid-binding protein